MIFSESEKQNKSSSRCLCYKRDIPSSDAREIIEALNRRLIRD
jgi:hypothetical protein